MGLNLLNKTELWINGITLSEANLTRLAEVVADVLALSPDKVLVVDVRERHITLDILEEDIEAEKIMGRERAVLEAVGRLPGVTVTGDTHIHSNGILGLICQEGEDPEAMARKVETMVNEIRARIAKRAIIFPTGFEVRKKMIEDTNTPYLRELLEADGFKVDAGTVIEDDLEDMVNKLSDALSRAYGLIITTGGVGAEDKDFSVESVLLLDPEAAAPYLVKFEKGAGRHVKDGVRIAVGKVGPSLIVALPGPNDEVRVAAAELKEAMRQGLDKHGIASRLVRALQNNFMEKKRHGHHQPSRGGNRPH